MIKRAAARAVLLTLCVCFVAAITATSAVAAAVTLTDDRGVAVTLAHPPQRIVTLIPSLTETICELGACTRLVGVDTFSDWPQRVRALPHVGGVDDASIETIVSLKPDLVLLHSTSRALTRLEALHVPVFGIDLKTMADVHRALATVGELVGVNANVAKQVSARIESGIDSAAKGIPPDARGTTIYFEVSDGPYAASASSHIGEILTRLGAKNIVPGELGSVPRINPEFVVRADPQVIIVSQREAASLVNRPGWNRMRAIRDGRVCALTQEQGDTIARPGPRLGEAAQALARCMVRVMDGKP